MLNEHILLLMFCAVTCPFQFLRCCFTVWFRKNFSNLKTIFLRLIFPIYNGKIIWNCRCLSNTFYFWCFELQHHRHVHFNSFGADLQFGFKTISDVLKRLFLEGWICFALLDSLTKFYHSKDSWSTIYFDVLAFDELASSLKLQYV
jgi:hypothetical protein